MSSSTWEIQGSKAMGCNGLNTVMSFKSRVNLENFQGWTSSHEWKAVNCVVINQDQKLLDGDSDSRSGLCMVSCGRQWWEKTPIKASENNNMVASRHYFQYPVGSPKKVLGDQKRFFSSQLAPKISCWRPKQILRKLAPRNIFFM